jgi:hypothetical protein
MKSCTTIVAGTASSGEDAMLAMGDLHGGSDPGYRSPLIA